MTAHSKDYFQEPIYNIGSYFRTHVVAIVMDYQVLQEYVDYAEQVAEGGANNSSTQRYFRYFQEHDRW